MTIGIDEVGRGPIAGPVTLCAFSRNRAEINDEVLLSLFPKGILRDSKKLTAKHRDTIVAGLEKLKFKNTISWAVASRTADEIDRRGISICIKECIQELLEALIKENNLAHNEVVVFLDGSLYAPQEYTQQQTIIKGDEKILEIACASIIAKVARDTYMKEMCEEFPNYGFEKHVGYGTKAHYKAIKECGLTNLHRKSYIKEIKIK